MQLGAVEPHRPMHVAGEIAQLQRGRRVLAWAARRSGELAALPLAWSSRPEALLELAVTVGALPPGARLASGEFLQRTLELKTGRLTGRLGPGRSTLHWR